MNIQTKNIIIKSNQITINGQVDFEMKKADFSEFIKSAYHHYNIGYPKFFKMDNLSKLAFVSAELLLRNSTILEKHKSEEIAIVLANSASSLNTDRAYYKSVKEDIASPALFVYTLPNIMIGEIAIRHKIKGENACFIFEKFEKDFINNYAANLIERKQAKACICGWVQLDGENHESQLHIVEKTTFASAKKELQLAIDCRK
ncbi:hypothetical protein JYU20_01600 [Bacteroidales bacterium AH-315-I05]|nr:hypothetical protein [Bacteroidales bacterium AH-315-I05]